MEEKIAEVLHQVWKEEITITQGREELEALISEREKKAFDDGKYEGVSTQVKIDTEAFQAREAVLVEALKSASKELEYWKAGLNPASSTDEALAKIDAAIGGRGK